MSTACLLDANNLAFRCYHAAKHKLTSVDGVETGSLHLFVTSLSRHLADVRPDRFVACWDGGGSTFRQALYPAYKAARRTEAAADAPEPHRGAFTLIEEFLRLTGLAQWRIPGEEADDLIAAGWKRARAVDDDVVILSGDKDLMQLLDDRTRLIKFTNNGAETWDTDRFFFERGYRPEQLPLVMALMGDPVDGVPGMRGVGPKKAMKMLVDADWNLDQAMERHPEHRLIVETSLALVDLRNPQLEVPEIPAFEPLTVTSHNATERLGHFTDFCARYQLVRLWDRLVAGQLWC